MHRIQHFCFWMGYTALSNFVDKKSCFFVVYKFKKVFVNQFIYFCVRLLHYLCSLTKWLPTCSCMCSPHSCKNTKSKCKLPNAPPTSDNNWVVNGVPHFSMSSLPLSSRCWRLWQSRFSAIHILIEDSINVNVLLCQESSSSCPCPSPASWSGCLSQPLDGACALLLQLVMFPFQFEAYRVRQKTRHPLHRGPVLQVWI